MEEAQRAQMVVLETQTQKLYEMTKKKFEDIDVVMGV